MSLFKKIAIVGTGLIGGSLALVIKKNNLAQRVVGFSRRKETIAQALKAGIIDEGSQDLNIIKGADFVILATPVDVILDLAPQIAKIIGKDAIVTDVGSTKEKIVSKLDKIFANFIGSHPLAGSEKRGVANAKCQIFQNSLCILTPTKKSKGAIVKKVKKFWKSTGANIATLDSAKHDKVLGFVSHLPHVVAFSLMSSVPKEHLKFAASGLRDSTRIAGSDAEVWSEIFLSNQKNLLKCIGDFEKNILKLKSAIRRKDKKAINLILAQAKKKREALK
ncbi:MAG: prephenate dehydrogenase/arogenate dehydrogenase family protein [Candidatus Omnitrophota bacterium]